MMTTTSGEPLQWTEDHYAVAHGRRADVERALLAMEHVDPEEPSDDDPAGATVLRKSVPGSALFGPGGFTSHARIVLVDDAVRVSALSVERADAMRAALEAACRGKVSHRQRTVTDAQEPMAKLRPEAPSPAPRRRGGAGPEADEPLRTVKAQHYRRWIDDDLPALGGLSPRTAVRVPALRAQVVTLLDEIDEIEATVPVAQRFATSELRRELGL